MEIFLGICIYVAYYSIDKTPKREKSERKEFKEQTGLH